MSTMRTPYDDPSLRAGAIRPGAFTIFDFNRLRRTTGEGAVGIAASIFLDIFNVFLLVLNLFGSGRE